MKAWGHTCEGESVVLRTRVEVRSVAQSLLAVCVCGMATLGYGSAAGIIVKWTVVSMASLHVFYMRTCYMYVHLFMCT